MGKRKSDILIPDFDSIVRREFGGRQIRVQHGTPFSELKPGAFTGTAQGRELAHRRWSGQRMVGEMQTITSMVVGEMQSRLQSEFLKDHQEIVLQQGVGEMITTAQGAMDLLEKVRLDIEFGLAEIPLLYGPIYERVNGPFPGGAVQIGPDMTLDASVMFLEHFEGEEIVFGTVQKAGAPVFAPITTYAAGFEWTEDVLEFDRTWEIGMNARAFGRAYNYLLNHIHLSPILSYAYGAAGSANHTGADATGGASLQARTLLTFQAAFRKAVMDVPQRTPSVVLANEADRFQIEDALLTPVLDANGNPLRRVPVDTIIYYNGATATNGVKQTVLPGVTAGTCYFIFPKMRFKELVHHDLRIDIGPRDISRLIEGQQVARTRRGLYVDIDDSVEKITLPV